MEKKGGSSSKSDYKEIVKFPDVSDNVTALKDSETCFTFHVREPVHALNRINSLVQKNT